jgi:hypothetical protein
MKIACRLLLMCILLGIGCRTASPVAPDGHPEWLISLIRQLEAEPVATPPAFIAQYEYRGERVYYLSARCCDIWSTLYRATGSIICHPDGGFGGGGDGRCPTFFVERTNERIVWRDSRGAT